MFTLWISQAGGRIDRVIIFNLIETIFALIWSCFALAFSCMPSTRTRCVSRTSKSMRPSWTGDGKHLGHYTKTGLCPSHSTCLLLQAFHIYTIQSIFACFLLYQQIRKVKNLNMEVDRKQLPNKTVKWTTLLPSSIIITVHKIYKSHT